MIGSCAIPASATLTTYCTLAQCTDSSTPLASFDTATSADTFSDIAFTQGNLGDTTSDLTVTFTSSTGLDGLTNIGGSWPAGSALEVLNNGANMTNVMNISTIPAGVNALDFYMGAQDNSDFQIDVTDTNGANFIWGAFAQPNSSTPVFFGVTTNASFASVSITTFSSVDHATVDNVQMGEEAAATPEVTTLLMVGTGLLLMGYLRRRKTLRTA